MSETVAEPTSPAVLYERAVALHRKEAFEEARPLYEAYLLARPADPAVWSNLGVLHRVQGRHDLALLCQRRAHALNPSAASVRNNLANALSDVGETEEALDLRRSILAEEPDNPDTRAMIGKALRALSRFDEGIAFLRESVARHPEHAELRVQLSLTLLAAGEYAEGFEHFEARWQTGELKARRIPLPAWRGEPLDGRRILVIPEQGFGDTIAMLRFLPVLREAGAAEVAVLAERPVARLFAGLPGADRTTLEARVSEFDSWSYVMDLPRHHFARRPGVPAPTALTVPQDSVARAKALLAPFAGLTRIGVVWTGSVTYRANAFRSFPHRELLRLADVPGVQLLSLYKGPRLADLREDGSSSLIFDIGSRDRDLADCAAVMRELDLVVTSCTVTAHLAGSLGVRTWLLLHWDTFWMWGRGTDRTPWYPSVRLFRQRTPRDWAGVMEEVRAALLAGEHREPW